MLKTSAAKHTLLSTLSLLVVLFLLSSCWVSEHDDVPPEPQEVSFDVRINHSNTTRAGAQGEMTLDKLKTSGFGVFAYYTDDQEYASVANPFQDFFQDFFYNQKVAYQVGLTHPWRYSPLKYWPNETGDGAKSAGKDRLSFFAYAPHVPGGSGTTGIISLMGHGDIVDPHLDYQITSSLVSGSEKVAPVDLLWGFTPNSFTYTDVEGQVYNEGDAKAGLPLLNLTKQKVNDDIKFQFGHALTQVVIKVTALVDSLDYKIIDPLSGDKVNTAHTRILVDSVVIGGANLVKKATLNLNNTTAFTPNWVELEAAATSTEYPSVKWNDVYNGSSHVMNDTIRGFSSLPFSGLSTPEDVLARWEEMPDGVTTRTNNLLNPGMTSLMLIPAFYGATTTLDVTVAYTVVTKDDKLIYNTPKGYSVVHNVVTEQVDFSTALVAGKIVTLKLNLGLTTVKFDIDSVVDWVTPVTFAPWVSDFENNEQELNVKDQNNETLDKK